MEYDAKLEKWYMYGQSIVGVIYGDKKNRFNDGEVIRTSTVYSDSDEVKAGNVIHTKNSSYLLGEEETSR